MFNPIALVPASAVSQLPVVAGLQVLPSTGPWTLLALTLDPADIERYREITQQDAKWLSWALARQHSALADICANVPAYPLQFGLIVPAIDELLMAASGHHEQLLSYFSLVSGAAEWGLKAILADAGDEPELAQPGMSGLAWLKAKQSAPERRRLRDEAALSKIQDAIAPLLAQARAHSDVHRQAVVPGPQRQQLLNVAVLVDDAHSAAFVRAADAAREALSREGITLSCSGPWPTYSFRPRLTE